MEFVADGSGVVLGAMPQLGVTVIIGLIVLSIGTCCVIGVSRARREDIPWVLSILVAPFIRRKNQLPLFGEPARAQRRGERVPSVVVHAGDEAKPEEVERGR